MLTGRSFASYLLKRRSSQKVTPGDKKSSFCAAGGTLLNGAVRQTAAAAKPLGYSGNGGAASKGGETYRLRGGHRSRAGGAETLGVFRARRGAGCGHLQRLSELGGAVAKPAAAVGGGPEKAHPHRPEVVFCGGGKRRFPSDNSLTNSGVYPDIFSGVSTDRYPDSDGGDGFFTRRLLCRKLFLRFFRRNRLRGWPIFRRGFPMSDTGRSSGGWPARGRNAGRLLV